MHDDARKLRSVLTFMLTAALAWGTAPRSARADGAGTAEMTGKAKAAAKKPAADNADKDKEEKPDFPKFAKVTKDFKKINPDKETFFTLYYLKKDDKLLAEIPSGTLNQHFLYASTLAGGPFATGLQWNHRLVYFDRMGKKLVFMEVDTSYAGREGKTVSALIKRSYTDRIISTVPIATMHDGNPLIDLGVMFKSDPEGLGRFFDGSADASLSKWVKYKPFAQNVELGVDTAFTAPGNQGGFRFRMHYSLSKIPKSDYKPRRADDRIGYFLTARMDWSKDHDQRTLFNRYINRWNLKKKAESKKYRLSPPERPIIWYIENTTPVPFRRYVRAGILEWNKAFEKCGFVDAIVVRQQSDDAGDESYHFDPEDVRYNFFRWMVTGGGFAAGPSRDHPLTGEIFDADIVFDDSMVRYWVTEHERFGGEVAALGEPEFFDPLLEDFLNSNPQWKFNNFRMNNLPNLVLKDRRRADWWRKMQRRLFEQGRPMCEFAAGLQHQIAYAGAVLQSNGQKTIPEEFLGQVITEVVMHEVGHTLGLRHNFKASTWKPLGDVLGSSDSQAATTGSVMDYNPSIFEKEGDEQCNYVTRTVGPYDIWAIEYGYSVAGEDKGGEDELLKKITGRVTEEGLAYTTDEDTFFFSPDPHSNRFDYAKNPMDYARRQVEQAHEVLGKLEDRVVKEGENYNRLRRSFNRVMFEFGRVSRFVARFVGGQFVARDHKGDEGARPAFTVVPAATQRQALKLLSTSIFAPDFFTIDPDLLNKLAPGRFWHWDSDEFNLFVEYPIHDMIAGQQYWSLFTLMNPFTVGRIYDAELQVAAGDDRYTLAEHMTGICDVIWSELETSPQGGRYSDREPYINSIRRNLQRMHLRMLLNIVLSEPGRMFPADANALARQCAVDLSARIAEALPDDKSSRVDTASRAHLADSKRQIDRALEAVYSFNLRGGSRSVLRIGRSQERPVSMMPNR